jgi:signal peptidase I
VTSVRGDDPDTSGTHEREAHLPVHAGTRLPDDDDAVVAGPPAGPDVDATGEADPDLPEHRHATPWWKETLLLVGTALILALIIKTFFVQAFYIPSGSMENTLKVNDRILVQKVSYWFGSPQRGDIVVFDDPDHWLSEEDGTSPSNPITKALSFVGLYPSGGHLVKRVIGVGGDEVRCHDGIVQVNGVNLKESSYVTIPTTNCLGLWDVKVPPNDLWVLGDNRENSADSRAHTGDPGGGFIPVDDVVGKVFVTVWPVDRWTFFHRPQTFDNPALNTAMGVVGDTAPLGAFLVLLPTLYRRATAGDELGPLREDDET